MTRFCMPLSDSLAERLAKAATASGLHPEAIALHGVAEAVNRIERDQGLVIGAKPPGAPVPLPGVPDDEL